MTLAPATNISTFAGLRIVQQMEEQYSICLALYGTGGAGKTTELAKIVHSPYGTPALLLDIEGGSSSVRHLISAGLDIVQIKSWPEVMKVAQALSKETHQYRSVIIDNLSELATLCMRNIQGTNDTPSIAQWGQTTSNMLAFVRMMRDMSRFNNLNTLFSIWEETQKDDSTGIVKTAINLTPKLAASFPGIITMMGHISINERTATEGRTVSFAPSNKTDAKFRVSPMDNAASIPQILFVRPASNMLADMLATIHDNTPFPSDKYAVPQRKQ